MLSHSASRVSVRVETSGDISLCLSRLGVQRRLARSPLTLIEKVCLFPKFRHSSRGHVDGTHEHLIYKLLHGLSLCARCVLFVVDDGPAANDLAG